MNVPPSSWLARLFAAAALVTVAVSAFAVWRAFATDTATAVSSPAGDSIDATGAIAVTIQDFAFGPQSVTVSAGSSIVWTNTDEVTHSVRPEESATGTAPFLEQTMARGGHAVVRLDQPGTYAYICGIHPAMTGTIEVTP